MEAVQQETSLKSKGYEWTKFIVTLLIIYFFISNTIGFAKVSGFSMSPTLKDGSLLLVNRLSTHIGKPKQGDVAIINSKARGYEIIKRVMALPGDRISIKDGTVFVNGKSVPEVYTQGKSKDMKEVIVPNGCVFVIGDNRDPGESLDSRDSKIGPLPISDIKGYAMVSVFPMYRIAKPLKV